MMKRIKCFLIILIISVLFTNYENIFSKQIFNSHKAGTWYPGNRNDLNNLIQSLSQEAKSRFDAKLNNLKIRALICPHAGYLYSGKVAAAAYRLLSNRNVERVIILAPSHFIPLKGYALPKFSKYQIPTGIINVDLASIRQLEDNSLAAKSNEFFMPEHSVEMQLPFIKYFFPKAEIVPIIVGTVEDDDVNELANLIQPLINKKTLVIVSTDFTHYGRSFDFTPFKDNILLRVNQLDSLVLNSIQHQDYEAFENILNKTHDTVCGYEPLKVLIKLMNLNVFSNVEVKLIAYGTSEEVTKDQNSLVSYASLVVTNQIGSKILNKQEKKSLLVYSRNVLVQSFKKTINVNLFKPIMTLLLEKNQAVFVTLYKFKNGKKELRGCIGTTLANAPLYKNVHDTLQSAYNDPRFEPVKENELSEIFIEISVLSEPRSIKSYKEIILNKHGIILEFGNKSALFLPQVPKEFGFDLKTTLQELSLKADLEKDSWMLPDVKFKIFETQDFMESF